MLPVLDRFYDQLGGSRVRCGHRTGGFSKILSHVSVLILVLAAVHVLRRQEWIAARPPRGRLVADRPVWNTALGYLIYLRDFFGAGVLGGSLVVSWLSWWIGFRNAKREIINGATGISPFEGMSTGLGYIIQCIALATAYLTTGIISICAWVVFALAAFYAVIRYSFRLYPRWARLHYPLMFRWTRFAAQASVRHLNSGQPVDFGPELCQLAAVAFTPSMDQRTPSR